MMERRFYSLVIKMKLSEYDDEELIEEIKHRGLKIEAWDCQLGLPANNISIKIGGVVFKL